METPREKYNSDAAYHRLVDMMCAQIHACNYTPSEMREAAILACILYEETKLRSVCRPLPEGIEDAFNKINEWTSEKS